MGETFGSRLKHAWNAFTNRDPTIDNKNLGQADFYRPDRPRFTRGNERSIITSIYNRIALDAASVDMKHVRLDANGRFLEEVDSGLNNCLNVEANLDQTSRAFKQDIYMSLMNEGVIAIVPVDTNVNPNKTESYRINSMRVGKIVQWYPNHVQVRLYDERTGKKQDLKLPKKMVAIVENPFFSVMNEPNSVMKRLTRKLNLLDYIDEQSGSGKLDLIIQLPYVIKSEARKQQAKDRLKDIETQLKGPYGIAYTDGSEKITQLNRPVENNLLKQIEYLQNMLFSQLSIDQSIMNGTADEKTMLNYNNRTIEVLVSAVRDEIYRKFLTKTARSQNQSIQIFRDPFRLVPVDNIAEIADKFTRNEIMSKNEFRQIIGMKPSNDPKADQLVNSNIAQPASATNNFNTESNLENKKLQEEEENQNGL